MLSSVWLLYLNMFLFNVSQFYYFFVALLWLHDDKLPLILCLSSENSPRQVTTNDFKLFQRYYWAAQD